MEHIFFKGYAIDFQTGLTKFIVYGRTVGDLIRKTRNKMPLEGPCLDLNIYKCQKVYSKSDIQLRGE